VASISPGRQLFSLACSFCHSISGTGHEIIGAAVSADISGPMPEDRYRGNDRLIERAILDGLDSRGRSLDPVMPRWRTHLTARQLSDLIAYIKTLRE
jgi:hypothetical protein